MVSLTARFMAMADGYGWAFITQTRDDGLVNADTAKAFTYAMPNATSDACMPLPKGDVG